MRKVRRAKAKELMKETKNKRKEYEDPSRENLRGEFKRKSKKEFTKNK